MSGIKTPILDIIAKLETGSFDKYSRIWNNQLERLKAGTMESFPMPAAFVEGMNDGKNAAPFGVSTSDVIFRIHILQTEYDAQDGRLGENKSIFDLRDEVILLLTNFWPTCCSSLMNIGETQDFNHDNVYHYTVDFICSFVDDTADARKLLITKNPPTSLQIDVTVDDVAITH